MASALDRNRRLFSGLFGSAYSAYIEREHLSRVIGRLLWGSDVRPYYASMHAVTAMPEGSTIIDCPCGSGVALRALRPGRRIRYLGFDLAPGMVERAIDQAAFAQAEATLPVEDGASELFLSYFGLHCFDDPEGALGEAARCLRPGGRLAGSAIVRGHRRLDRLRVRPGSGGFGRVGDEQELEHWLRSAGFEHIEIETSGIFSVFSARNRE